MTRRPLVLAAAAALSCVLLAPAAATAATEATIGSTATWTDSAPPAAPVMQRGSYDYAPSVMFDATAGLYRMWWCGGVAGDYILYAESPTLAGPFRARGSAQPNTYDIALRPSRDKRAFDHTHTCDPSVIKVGSTWYLYYGGGNEREQGHPTRIGLATSTDGITWTRANGGRPILEPARSVLTTPTKNGYGAGQPSVVHVDGRFHLVFTDTTAYGGNQGNGAGQYVLRSADPTLKTGTDVLLSGGFAPYAGPHQRTHSILEAFSTDWTYSPSLQAFVLTESRTDPTHGRIVQAHFFRPTLLGSLAGSPARIPVRWAEGTGLVGDLGRQLAAPVGGDQRLEVMRPMGDADPFTWRLHPTTATVPVVLPSR